MSPWIPAADGDRTPESQNPHAAWRRRLDERGCHSARRTCARPLGWRHSNVRRVRCLIRKWSSKIAELGRKIAQDMPVRRPGPSPHSRRQSTTLRSLLP